MNISFSLLEHTLVHHTVQHCDLVTLIEAISNTEIWRDFRFSTIRIKNRVMCGEGLMESVVGEHVCQEAPYSDEWEEQEANKLRLETDTLQTLPAGSALCHFLRSKCTSSFDILRLNVFFLIHLYLSHGILHIWKVYITHSFHKYSNSLSWRHCPVTKMNKHTVLSKQVIYIGGFTFCKLIFFR